MEETMLHFKEFMRLSEAGENPLLKGVNQQVSSTVNNLANAPSNQNKTSGDLAKAAMVGVAKQGKTAEIEALANQAKGPQVGNPATRMMKKKMKKK
jgi:hypothetical protein